ncbi:MAG: PIN domain-containing protein [Chitinophagales bacterium]|nr:PIN domain-containing protein [Chitinophagales bacterium]
MIKVFIDTDVIIDFLGDRKPFSKHAQEIFMMSYRKQIQLFTSSNSITTGFYLLCKMANEKKSRELIYGLLKYMSVIPITEKILVQALNSSFKDFEDAVQHYAAHTETGIKTIVTRNLRDFAKSTLLINSPEEFVFNN